MKIKTIDYEMYLFSSLLKIHDVGFDKLPYDVQFSEIPKKYNEFVKSKYNIPTREVYECMEEFLLSK